MSAEENKAATRRLCEEVIVIWQLRAAGFIADSSASAMVRTPRRGNAERNPGPAFTLSLRAPRLDPPCWSYFPTVRAPR